MGIAVHLHTLMPLMPAGLPRGIQIALLRGIQVAVIAVFFVSTLTLSKNVRLRKYWRLAFSYFVASCAFVLSDFTGDWAVITSGQSFDTAIGFTVLKGRGKK